MVTTASTPPPPSSLHEPPTPKHGWDDHYEPYSPRKSTRVSAQRMQRAAKTPPPQFPHHSMQNSHSSPPSTTRKITSTNMPTSPPSAIAKKRTSAARSSRRIEDALNDDNMFSAATALLPPSKGEMEAPQSMTVTRNHGMLPTPDKTPRKRPSQAAPGISAIARNLFPVRPETIEEVMPTPKKKNKKYSGFTLDSFTAEEEAPIQIFTDSHDRIPEIDLSVDNPFYGAGPAIIDPTKRSGKRRKIAVPGEGEQTVEEAEKRDDGLVYVFRGKKIFRKFTDEDDTTLQPSGDSSGDELDMELDATVPARLRGPLTRSSLKPRLLFPTAEQVALKAQEPIYNDEDEEAVTDIEESHDFTTPAELADEPIATPKAPRFAPASPPTTVRTTRSKKIEFASPATPSDEISDHEVVRTRGGKVSPFDNWKLTKTVATRQSRKRQGDAITKSGGDITKRQRGGQAI